MRIWPFAPDADAGLRLGAVFLYKFRAAEAALVGVPDLFAPGCEGLVNVLHAEFWPFKGKLHEGGHGGVAARSGLLAVEVFSRCAAGVASFLPLHLVGNAAVSDEARIEIDGVVIVENAPVLVTEEPAEDGVAADSVDREQIANVVAQRLGIEEFLMMRGDRLMMGEEDGGFPAFAKQADEPVPLRGNGIVGGLPPW